MTNMEQEVTDMLQMEEIEVLTELAGRHAKAAQDYYIEANMAMDHADEASMVCAAILKAAEDDALVQEALEEHRASAAKEVADATSSPEPTPTELAPPPLSPPPSPPPPPPTLPHAPPPPRGPPSSRPSSASSSDYSFPPTDDDEDDSGDDSPTGVFQIRRFFHLPTHSLFLVYG